MVKRRQYQHESRHLHALRRLRTKSGRFLTRAEREAIERGEYTIETLPVNVPPKQSIVQQVAKATTNKLIQERKQMAQYLKQAHAQKTLLVPIRIDEEGIQDRFLWNLKETQLKPKDFCEWYCEDLGLPEVMEEVICESMEEQIAKYQKLINQIEQNVKIEKDEKIDSSLLIEIKLEVRKGEIVLIDRFAWDLLCMENSPEKFAISLCKDLELEPEFVPLVTQAIYEEIFSHIQRIAEGKEDRRSIEPIEKPEDVIRDIDDQEEWEPQFKELTEEELQRIAMQEERQARYRRRHGTMRTRSASLKEDLSVGSILKRRSTTSMFVEPEKVYDECIHCGCPKWNTPIMRKGPDGAKSLCNKCGLAFATGRLHVEEKF